MATATLLHESIDGPHRLSVTATLRIMLPEHQLKYLPDKADYEMRVTFNIEMTVDVLLSEEERKRAFMDLVSDQARRLYGVASVLTKKRAPEMKASMIDGNGKTYLNVFNQPVTE